LLNLLQETTVFIATYLLFLGFPLRREKRAAIDGIKAVTKVVTATIRSEVETVGVPAVAGASESSLDVMVVLHCGLNSLWRTIHFQLLPDRT